MFLGMLRLSRETLQSLKSSCRRLLPSGHIKPSQKPETKPEEFCGVPRGTVGRIQNFVNAVREIPGLELQGEHELEDIEPDYGFEDESKPDKASATKDCQVENRMVIVSCP